jgi:hypothetical protein
MAVCPHCSLQLDEQTMSDSIATQDRTNNAYNSASNIRILAGAMWMFFFFSLLPFIGIIGRIGFYIAFAGVPILLIVWVIRYWSIPKSEPDIAGARKYLLTALGIWAIYPAVLVILTILVFLGALAYEISK